MLLVEVPCGAASRGPWGQNKKPKNLEIGAIIGPSDQNQLYHTPLLFKIRVLTKNKKIVNDPLKQFSVGTFFTCSSSPCSSGQNVA